jgi:hypothetical protein
VHNIVKDDNDRDDAYHDKEKHYVVAVTVAVAVYAGQM